MREIVRYVRDAKIDEIILAIPWDKQDVIDEIESELRVLPLPIKLVPDCCDRTHAQASGVPSLDQPRLWSSNALH